MKNLFPFLVLPLLCLTPLAACKEKTPAQKTQDKVDDALDRRPNEKIRDAAEDIRDDAKDAAQKAADLAKEAAEKAAAAAKEAAEKTKEAVHDTAEKVKDATE